MLRNIFSSTQGAYIRQISVRHDLVSDEGMNSVVDSILVNPGVQQWLAGNTPDWRPEFQEYIRERLALLCNEVE